MIKVSYMNVYASLVSQCAENGKVEAQLNAMVGDPQPLLLYFRKSTSTANGELKLVSKSDKAPDGFALVTDEQLDCGVPYEGYFSWVHARCLRTEILMSAMGHHVS
jgi:hypothetical protein